jgi:hypothetical protein
MKEIIGNLNFEDGLNWPLNQWINSIWEKINDPDGVKFDCLKHEIRRIYAEGFNDGQKFVWDLRAGKYNEDIKGINENYRVICPDS